MKVLRSPWALTLLALGAAFGPIVYFMGDATIGQALPASLSGIVLVLLAAAMLSPD